MHVKIEKEKRRKTRVCSAGQPLPLCALEQGALLLGVICLCSAALRDILQLLKHSEAVDLGR